MPRESRFILWCILSICFWKTNSLSTLRVLSQEFHVERQCRMLYASYTVSVLSNIMEKKNSKRSLTGSATVKPGCRIRDWHWGDNAAEWWGLGNQKKTLLQVIVQGVHRACAAFWLGAGSGLHLHYLISPPEIIVFLSHLHIFGGHLVQPERTKKIWTTRGLSTSL